MPRKPRHTSVMKRVTLYLPEDMHAAYKQLAKRRGVSSAELMRRAVDRQLYVYIKEDRVREGEFATDE